MSAQDAIEAAQRALPELGASGNVVDVRREGREVILVFDDHSTVRVGGFLAIKFRKMLTTNFLRYKRR